MFVAPWEQGGEWDDSGISGMSRWLNRVWKLVLEPYRYDKTVNPSITKALERGLLRGTHQTIRKVTSDLERIHFNTMIAALMELTNYLAKIKEDRAVSKSAWGESVDVLLLLLAPTAPHLAEELWEGTGHSYSIHNQSWPSWDKELAKDEEITLVVQINGKLRDRISVPASITEADAKQVALEREKIKAYLGGKNIVNIIYVPGRLVNMVVK